MQVFEAWHRGIFLGLVESDDPRTFEGKLAAVGILEGGVIRVGEQLCYVEEAERRELHPTKLHVTPIETRPKPHRVRVSLRH